MTAPATLEQLRPCIGCGKRQVRGRHYCSRCRGRLRAGLPLDLEDFVTAGDVWPSCSSSRRRP